MAKPALRIQARRLRQNGISVKTIARELGISRSTASIWVRDIILTVEQLEVLRQSSLSGRERGRLKSAFSQKQKRLQRIEIEKLDGQKSLGKLSEREILLIGIALYWAEGCKKTQRLELCNSDPKMIQFFLHWLRTCLLVEDQDIRCNVGINIAHESRDTIVKAYWSGICNIPLSQFTRTSFKKVQNKKTYENFTNHYGVCVVRVIKPSRYYFKIIGLIDAMSKIGKNYTLNLLG